MTTIVDIVEQGSVPILLSLQQMMNLQMKLDMRPDRVLIACEALGLHHAQATQASSSHIVIDLVVVLSVPSRTLSNGESDFACFFCGDSEVSLGTCSACSGRHRPHTYAEGCKKSTTSIAAEPKPSTDSSPVEGASLDRVLADPLLVD